MKMKRIGRSVSMKKLFQYLTMVIVLSATTLHNVRADPGDAVFGPSYWIDIAASCGYDIDSSQWEYGRQFIVEVRDPRGYLIDRRVVTDYESYTVIGTEKGCYTVTAYGFRFLDIGFYRYEWHIQKEKTVYVDEFDVCYFVHIHL